MALLDKLSNTLSETTKILGEKSSEVVEINKLNLSIRKKQNEINEIYEKIGEYIYGKFKRVNFITKEELDPWLNEIDALEKHIESLDRIVRNIKSAKYCSNCEIELDKDINYCPLCGKYLN